MSHTKEPWFVSSGRDGQVVAEIVVGNGSPLRIRANALEEGNANEDALRIVACVNACAGISTDDLERYYNTGGGIDEAMEEASLRAHVTAVKQRNELLAALRKLSGMKLNMIADGIVDKAIASVNGGAE